MPLVTNKDAIYSDIDLSFEANPRTKDIVTLTNAAAINRSINHALFFNKFDIPFNNQIYSSVKNILFEPITFITAISLTSKIRDVIKKLDPRVDVQDVIVKENLQADGFDVTLVYNIKYYQDNIVNKLFLQRIR